jgi:hypothetical protein
MYSILFSFLKPQIAFGGDSGGGGGSSSGGGGGSRADKKGAAAVLSAPKPAPRPVVNTSRDASDRKGAAAVMSAPKPPSGPSAAQRARAAQAEKDRVAREAQAAQAAKDRAAQAAQARAAQAQAERDRIAREAQAAQAAQAKRDRIVREAQARAEEDNRSIFDQLENIQLVSKDRPELQYKRADAKGAQAILTQPPKNLGITPELTKKQISDANLSRLQAEQNKRDEDAKGDRYNFFEAFNNDPTANMPGSPRNLQDEVDFQERMMRQNIAAAIDPYGQSTATDSNLTSRAVDMLNKGNMSKEQYEQAVKDLGARLDQPRFGDSGLGKMFEASPLGQGLDYLGDMNQRRAYEKLTGQYEPGFLASVFTNYGDGERQVPVFDNGQIIGALGVDAEGNIINYTGEHSDTAQVFDETIDADKAKDYTKVYDTGDPSRLDGSDNNDRGRGEEEDGEEGGAEEPTCPDGYIFDSETNACILDPFQDPFPDAPTTGGGTYTAPALSAYTNVSPIGLPTLMPGQQQPYMVPTANVQPITVAAQTPAGLASLKRS